MSELMTRDLLNAIKNPANRRRDVVPLYVTGLNALLRGSGAIFWPAVNRAIMNRWSRHALSWIKQRAWKMVDLP